MYVVDIHTCVDHSGKGTKWARAGAWKHAEIVWGMGAEVERRTHERRRVVCRWPMVLWEGTRGKRRSCLLGARPYGLKEYVCRPHDQREVEWRWVV